MKKILLVYCLTLFASKISAQEFKHEAGVAGGLNIASLRGYRILDDDRMGYARFTGGAWFGFNFNSNIALLLGCNYDAKGSAYETVFTDENGLTIGKGKFKYQLDYITIPLKLRVGTKGKVKVYGEVGPFISILTNAEYVAPEITPAVSEKTDVKDQFENSDAGLSLGLGVKINLVKNLNLMASVSDNLGLMSVYKKTEYFKDDVKTNAVSIVVGISFDFGEKKN